MLSLSERLRGTLAGHIRQEFLANSAYFPVANILLELLREGFGAFMRSPDPYVLLVVGLMQAFWLGRWKFEGRPRPLVGNLVGPAVYTVAEGLVEGAKFFAAPHHIAYWAFSFVIGLCQQVRVRSGNTVSPFARTAAILVESLARAGILLGMYWLFEFYSKPADASIAIFFSDPSHIYIALVLAALGLVIGFAQISSENHLAILQETALQLRRYSEWAMGSELVARAVGNAGTLSLRRRERTLVFIDIRGFTSWSEPQPPEKVVDMLNAFYRAIEDAIAGFKPIKAKFSADEALVVFEHAQRGLDAARALLERTALLLDRYGLAAGIGIHSGAVVEGLLGSESIKAYDVIGDSVNLAKRLCDNAGGGELLVSAATVAECGEGEGDETRTLSVKGKSQALTVRVIRRAHR